MWFVAMLACSQVPQPVGAAPEPSTVIPEAEAPAPEARPALPSATPGPQSVPAALAALYTVSLGDRGQLIVDPIIAMRRDKTARSGGVTTIDTENGGKEIQLDDGPITQLEWSQGALETLALDADSNKRLTDAGYALDVPRDLLTVGNASGHTTRFAFSLDPAKRGLVAICTEVTVVDFATPSRPMVARKPVIYAYPLAPTKLTVAVDVDGEFTTVYPPMRDGQWRVHADPTGTLTMGDRTHDYLFWEATSPRFSPDPSAAFSVARSELPDFLHGICDTFALTDSECGDFVTYWLPEMSLHPFVTVSFPLDDYERYASLRVHPEPDTMIRLFMVYAGTPHRVSTVAPKLVQREREGFTVVEWGGTEAVFVPR